MALRSLCFSLLPEGKCEKKSEYLILDIHCEIQMEYHPTRWVICPWIFFLLGNSEVYISLWYCDICYCGITRIFCKLFCSFTLYCFFLQWSVLFTFMNNIVTKHLNFKTLQFTHNYIIIGIDINSFMKSTVS